MASIKDRIQVLDERSPKRIFYQQIFNSFQCDEHSLDFDERNSEETSVGCDTAIGGNCIRLAAAQSGIRKFVGHSINELGPVFAPVFGNMAKYIFRYGGPVLAVAEPAVGIFQLKAAMDNDPDVLTIIDNHVQELEKLQGALTKCKTVMECIEVP